MGRVLFWRLLVSAVLVAGAGALVVLGVRGLLTHGQRGHLTVAECTFLSYGTHVDTYRCTGSFVADGERFTIARVSFVNTGRLRAGQRIAATVAGPGAGTATPAGEATARIFVTGGGTLVCLLFLGALWRRRPVRPAAARRSPAGS